MNPHDATPAARALKSDIKDWSRFVAFEFGKINARIDRLEESLTVILDEGFAKILKPAEDFLARVHTVEHRDHIITQYRIDELEKRVRALEEAH